MKDVLLIDDEPLFRRSVVQGLRNSGYRFLEAELPSQGVQLLDENPQVRVILLDLSFPDEDDSATVVLDYVRQRPSDYRVIVLTAHEELLPAEKALVYDVFHYLPKSHRLPAIQFSLDQAFKDLDRAIMAHRIDYLQEVQRRVSQNHGMKE